MQVGQSGKELLKDKNTTGAVHGTHSFTLEGSGMDAKFFLPSTAFEWWSGLKHEWRQEQNNT